MTLSKIFIVAKKEMIEIIKTKSQMLVGLFFALWFSVMSAPVVKTVDEAAVFDTFNNLMFYFVLMMGIFMAYMFSGKVFFNEKREGNIETLLCTPLSLRQIWFGKVVGVSIVAYLIALLSAALITIIANIFSTSMLLPLPAIFVHIFLVVPAFIAVAVGLLGFGHLLLGMRENQILNISFFIVIFFAFSLPKNVIGGGFAVSWIEVGVLLMVAVLLLVFVSYLTRYLSKERIVTTIA
ncbi:MAG: ABC transporter permease [Methanosarcinales archaeon]|nr:ABC transporter permease [Methanosarcinales archaeon]